MFRNVCNLTFLTRTLVAVALLGSGTAFAQEAPTEDSEEIKPADENDSVGEAANKVQEAVDELVEENAFAAAIKWLAENFGPSVPTEDTFDNPQNQLVSSGGGTATILVYEVYDRELAEAIEDNIAGIEILDVIGQEGPWDFTLLEVEERGSQTKSVVFQVNQQKTGTSPLDADRELLPRPSSAEFILDVRLNKGRVQFVVEMELDEPMKKSM